jgi:hypothetical protein
VAADDLPYDALENLFNLEDASASPLSKILLKWLSRATLPPPFDKIFRTIKEMHGEDSVERILLLLKTLQDEMRRVTGLVESLYSSMLPEEIDARSKTMFELLLDAARKAEQTRSQERIRHIGTILAGAAIDSEPVDADGVEEMMRVAMDVGDQEIVYLRELVRISGAIVAKDGRIDRKNAYDRWESGFWGTQPNPDLDSAFSKLESYGLVSRIAPPNNLNIFADFQNRYALLPKGLRFAESIKSCSESPRP